MTTHPDKITYREFRMWLDGLLSGNEDRSALPSRDQWGKILAMLDRVEEVPESALSATAPWPTATWGGPGQPFQNGSICTGD